MTSQGPGPVSPARKPHPGTTAVVGPGFTGPFGGKWTRAIAMFVLAGFTVIFGLLLTYNGQLQVRDTERTLANGIPTTSRVESVEARELPGEDHGQFKYIAHVVFETEGAPATAELPQVDSVSDYEIGESVAIIYDRDDPSAVLLDRDDILVNPYAGLYGGLAICAFGVVLVIVGFRKRIQDGRLLAPRKK